MDKTAQNKMTDIQNDETAADHQDQDQATASADDAIAAMEKERDEMRDKMMRALAEADNIRKRAEKAQADTAKYAVAGFAKDMLEIADNLRRALDAVTEDQRKDQTIALLYNGVEATEKVMLSVFERQGLQKIEPQDGKFDPNIHEVMFEADVPGKEAGMIIQLLEPGYMLNDRLLRPARVGVAKGTANSHTVDTQA